MPSDSESEVDIYRDTPIRYLGYANEVGEAFRALIPRSFVNFSYGTAFTYVLADTYDKTKRVPDSKKKLQKGLDVLIWQTLASVVIPGFTINRVCYVSSILLRRSRMSPLAQRLTTTAIGLACIPIIIKPIDKLVDLGMDRTYRRIFPS